MSGTEDQESLYQTIIIDIGQALTKVGFAGEEMPRSIFPTVVGTPKFQTMAGLQTKETYVGEGTTRMRGVLKLAYPISRGNVLNWDQYFEILNHIFYNVLRIVPKYCNVIYLIPPLTPPETAVYFARVLFESHQFNKVALIDTATTSIFSVGQTTGLSIEMGAGITTIAPVMDGQVYLPSIQRINLAGMDIEEYLGKLLTHYGIFQKKEIITEIKEKSLKLTLIPEKSIEDPNFADSFLMPDGETLKIHQYITCMGPEILFSPNLDGINSNALPTAIISALRSVDPGYLRPLLKHVIISGGTSYIAGLKERLKFELKNLLPSLGEIPDDRDIVEIEEIPPEVSHEDPLIHSSKPENCSKCGELVDSTISDICPFCNAKLHLDQILIHDDDDKLSRKEKKIIKKTAISDDDFNKIANSVADEYGDEDDYEEIIEIENKMENDLKKQENSAENLIQITLDENRRYAAFKGAAILGSLPVFQSKMLDYSTFQSDPNRVIIKFHEVMNM